MFTKKQFPLYKSILIFIAAAYGFSWLIWLPAVLSTRGLIGPAGSAVIWNVICWHTGLANVSPRDRRLVIYGYMPFWVKKWEERMPPESILDWANTPIRRQMMGIHAVYGRNVWDRKDVPRLPEQDAAFQGHRSQIAYGR